MKGSARSLLWSDPDNPFFRFLFEGVTQQTVQRVLERCPVEQPSPEKSHRDFQWQRFSEDQVYGQTDGHDCVFMINLLLSEIKNRDR